jgi:hypothetical protein
MVLVELAIPDSVTVKQSRDVRKNKMIIAMLSESRDCVEVLYLLRPCYMHSILMPVASCANNKSKRRL